MTEKSFWELTDTEKTDDISKLHAVYEDAVKQYKNDIVTILRLKKAYAHAMEQVFENEIRPRTEKLINKIDKLYSDIDTRFDTDAWNKLFDENCSDKDSMFDYTRNEILAYFLYHEYIPQSVWQVLDRHLHIMLNYENLKLSFPIAYIQSIKQTLNGEQFFEVERVKYISGENKNPDEYIQALFDFADAVEYEPSEKIKRRIKKMETYGFYHPYHDAEIMNYLVRTGENDMELERLCGILENDENTYILSCVGWAYWYLGRIDDADIFWQRVLEHEPEHKKALFGHASYLFENECYEQAKDCLFTILETYGESDEVMKLLTDINEIVMKHYIELYEENSENLYDGIQYAWCLCQNGQWEEVTDFLLGMDEDESISYDINMLLGRAYYSMAQYKEALGYLQKWIKQMMLLPCDGSEEYEEKIERYPAALAVIGETYHELGELEKAVYYMEQSMHAYDKDDGERFKSMTRLSDFYNEAEQFEKALEISEEVIKTDDCYVWAYIAHQKAAFELNNETDVIRDYAVLANLVPNISEPYIYALKIYIRNGLYDDARIVIERAAANGIENRIFDIAEYITDAARAETEDINAIISGFKLWCKHHPELLEDKKMCSQVYMTAAYRYREAGLLDSAANEVSEAIKLFPDNPYYKWEMADLYFKDDRDSEALELYKMIYDELSDNNSFLCDYAFCMQYNNIWEESAEILQKVLKTDNTYMADAYMMRYYKHLYSRDYSRENFEKAKIHIERQIEKTPENLFAISECMLLLKYSEDRENLEEAARECILLIEQQYGDVNIYQYHLEDIYIRLGNLKKAFDEITHSARTDNCPPDYHPFRIRAILYEKLNKPEVSESLMSKAYNQTKDARFCKFMADYSLKNGNYKQAINGYKKYRQLCCDGDSGISLLFKAYLLNGSKILVRRTHKTVFDNLSCDNACEAQRMAWHYFDILLDAPAAIRCMEKTLKYLDKSDLCDAYSALALFYRYINDDETAKRYAKKLLNEIEKKCGGGFDKYLNIMRDVLTRTDDAVLYHIGMGDFKTAEEYINKMLDRDVLCHYCNEPCCTDAYIRLAQIRILQGDFEGMQNVCHALLEKCKNDVQAQIYLNKQALLEEQYKQYRQGT